MTELDAFLTAIDANPTDDGLWLVFADWLEERGDRMAGLVRRTIERRNWQEGYDRMSGQVGFRSLQLLACDSVEPVIPAFERCYPGDRTPRRLVETLRRFRRGRWLNARAKDAAESLRIAIQDHTAHGRYDIRRLIDRSGDYWRFGTAVRVAQHVAGIISRPRRACFDAAYTAALLKTELIYPFRSKSEDFRSRAAVRAEVRRLVARAIVRHVRSTGYDFFHS